MAQLNVSPLDEANTALLASVRPDDWINPRSQGRYHLVVIGGGTAGLVTAAGAAGLGAKVALIERDLMGGDCLNVGCVPSKSLIRAARSAAEIRRASEFGIRIQGDLQIDFEAVMRRVRQLRAGLSPHDSFARFRDLGVDVYQGTGIFTSRNKIQVGDQTLQFRNAVVASGARAVRPDIPGLSEVDVLTNENVFNLTSLPRRMAVIGAGPIGCELAQSFVRFGTQVTLIDQSRQILPKEDPAATEVLEAVLTKEGVDILHETRVSRVESSGQEKILRLRQNSTERTLIVDAILIGVGRAPNVTGLGLELAGIQFDQRQGIQVDDHLRTTNRQVFAAGDVCSRLQFTHAADFQARIVIQNALFWGRSRASALNIPWCTYTSPEIAHVGISEKTAQEQNIAIDTFQQQLDKVDRAVLDGESGGFVKIHVARGTDRILGATIVAAHAGDLISEISVAMAGKLGLKRLASVIHPYPTQADAIRKIGDTYNRTRLTPFVKSLFDRWLKWTQ